MSLQPYRRVLTLPLVPSSLLLMFFARLPAVAVGITLTLHVVSDLGRGYGEAGLVGTATTAGSALGAPLVGRLIDRYGLRPVVALSATAAAAYVLSTPHLPYLVLLVVAFPAGMLTMPTGSLARQVLAALVPDHQRRTAYSLDSISLDISFMIGPAGGILLSTQFSSTVSLSVIGLLYAAVGLALYVLNPPVRAKHEITEDKVRPPLRSWLSRELIATLLVAGGALFVLMGIELAALAALRENGEVEWTGAVMAVMCVASLAGGLVHGAVRRSLPQLTLMVLLAVLAIPVGIFDEPWWLLALVLIPTNVVCAPTLASTTESVAALAPPRVRGEAMGLQDSATRLGMAVGSPAVGFVMDHSSPGWGFAAAGIGGLVLAGLAVVLRRIPAKQPVPTPAG